MASSERLQNYLTLKEITEDNLLEAIKFGSNDVEVLLGLNKPVTFSLSNVIPKCPDLVVLEMVLRAKKYNVRRRHNRLLTSLENEEFVDYLVHHPRSALNPGFRQSLPLMHAVNARNEKRVRTFLLSMRCDIHARPSDYNFTIVQHAIADNYRPILEMFALVYRRSRWEYEQDDAKEIDEKMKQIRREMCVKQSNAKIGLLEIIRNNRGRYNLQGYLDIALFVGLQTSIANHKLCPSLQVSETRDFIRKNIY